MARSERPEIDTLAKFKAHWHSDTFDARCVLADYSRVLVYAGEATVLEAAPSVVDARCTACPLLHGRHWDCTQPGITERASRIAGHRVGYCPVLGTAAHHVMFTGDPVRTKHRRLYRVPARVTSFERPRHTADSWREQAARGKKSGGYQRGASH
jgi:hypothetical protein